MLRRLMLGGALIMLLATSSLAARKPVGAHCEFDRQCASSNCKDGVCRKGPHRPLRRLPAGAPCRRNMQCASGSCSGGAPGARHCK